MQLFILLVFLRGVQMNQFCQLFYYGCLKTIAMMTKYAYVSPNYAVTSTFAVPCSMGPLKCPVDGEEFELNEVGI